MHQDNAKYPTWQIFGSFGQLIAPVKIGLILAASDAFMRSLIKASS